MKKPKSKIPKIIHQTWKDHNIPEYMQPLVESWKNQNPGWKYILWTDKSMLTFVNENFPELMELYKSYPEEIYRADVFRLLVLYKIGGVYVDLDSKCLKSLDNIFKSKKLAKMKLILTRQPGSHYKYQYHHLHKIRVCNSFMASTPLNENIKILIEKLEIKNKHHEASHETGPLHICRNFDQLDKSGIKVLSYKYFNPIVDITNRSLPSIYRKKSARMIINNSFYKETIGVHYWNHIYSSPESKRSLKMNSDELNKLSKINFFDWLNLIKKFTINCVKRFIHEIKNP